MVTARLPWFANLWEERPSWVVLVPMPDLPRLAGRTVLVTGGAGFIGSRLAAHLLEAGARVIVADDLSGGLARRLAPDPRLSFRPLDVTAPGAVSGLLGEEGDVDTIVHLAARVGVRRVLADPEGCWSDHLAGGRELLAAIDARPAHSRPRVLAASTSEVYRDQPGPLGEGAALRSLGGRGRWAYAASKLAVERLLDACADLWPAGRGPIHLRFFNVVGPGQDASSGMVLPTFVEQALAGQPLTVHGDGTQARTFAHVDDVAADLVRLLALEDAPAGPLNLGGAARATVAELARLVADRVGSGEIDVIHTDPERTVSPQFQEVQHREPDLGRARALGLGCGVRDLSSIIADTVERHPTPT
jgi:UDP-glucose 4-epimerase